MKFRKSKIFKWIDERYEITPLVDYMSKKDVPLGSENLWKYRKEMPFSEFLHRLIHRHYLWYYFGGITLFLFIVLIISGFLLLFHYKGGVDTAYDSVKDMISNIEFGWLIRSVHSWAANLMILAAFIHMFSVLFTKAYRKPRELTWVTGVFILALSMGAGFTGYLLPWNKLSYFAVQIGTDMMKGIPLIGDYLLEVLRGGNQISGATLHRFLGLHVAIIPLGIVILVGIHLLFIQRQGISEPMEIETGKAKMKELTGVELNIKTMKFFPNFILRDLVVWLIVLNILVLLAVFFPWELGEKADPLAPPPPNLKPEWFFLAMYVVIELVPIRVALIFFGILGITWLLIPFWDRKASRGEKSNFVLIFGIVFTVLFVILTIIGYLFPTNWFSKLHF